MPRLVLQDYYLGRRAEFVENVDWFRQRRSMQKSELARAVMQHDIPLATAKRWVQIGPPFNEIWRFEQALGVPAAYLVMRQNISVDANPETAELLLLWSYLDSDIRAAMLEMIRVISLRGEMPMP